MKIETVFGCVGLVALVVLAGVFGAEQPDKDKHESPMEPICTVNESAINTEEGWRQVPTGNRDVLAKMHADGKVELAYRPGTIICTIFRDGAPLIDARGGLWYWRMRLGGRA